MRRQWLFLLNFAFLSFGIFFLTGFQTSFWFQIFGDWPAPQLWLIIVIFSALYRRSFSGLLSIYAFGFFVTSFSVLPLKVMYLILLELFVVIHLVKNRIFWTGPGYFTLMVGFGTFCYEIIYLLTSVWIEKSSAPLLIGTRLVHVILTPLFGYLLYFPLSALDRLTLDKITTESGGLEA